MLMTLDGDPEVLRLKRMVVRRPLRDSAMPVRIRAAAAFYGDALDPADRPVSRFLHFEGPDGNEAGFYVVAPHAPWRPSNDRMQGPVMSVELQWNR